MFFCSIDTNPDPTLPSNQSKIFKMSNYVYGDKYSPFLHDAVILYATALNQTMNIGGDVRAGNIVAEQMRGRSFIGVSGIVVLDENGDRDPDYWITDMAPNGTFIKIAEILNGDGATKIFRKDISPPRWPNGKIGHEFAPPDTPLCGFRNELCETENVASWIITLAVVVSLLAVSAGSGLGVYLYKRGRYEAELLLQTWKVEWEDIESVRTAGAILGGSTPTLISNNLSGHSKASSESNILLPGLAATEVVDISKSSQSRSQATITSGAQVFADIALYKGVVVALKRIKKEHMQVNRAVLIEFSEMKDILHENLNVFVGACIEPPNICILWQYCSKGSLLDVLENDDYKLDSTFKVSFMVDIASGMQYLHSAVIGSHGNLKDSNCLIDCRWSVKVTDYGLSSFLSGQDVQESENEQYKRKLWTPPELLRENFPPPKGTPKGDVYSFAIIAYEIIMRGDPYSFDTMTPRDVVNRVRNGESIPFRPILPETTDLGKPMLDMIRKCWAEDPAARPMFAQIRAILKKMAKGNINIMDKVLKMMEKYAYNLESIVEERTQQLIEEKKKTDKLLYRMLPSTIFYSDTSQWPIESLKSNFHIKPKFFQTEVIKKIPMFDRREIILLDRLLKIIIFKGTVAEQLKAGLFVQPENYDHATVYFSDVVGFSQMASESSPMQIVDFLNDLYSCFDAIIAEHDVYKVETIGDAYMVVSGLPVRNGMRHVAEIANVSLDLLSEVTHFKIRHRPHQQLLLRVGLHSGPVVAGVVGLVMPRYCLFGDTVNMAARMESNGKPLRIHISKATYILLSEGSNEYEMTLRGEMNVKGKGLQMTYWLHGRRGFTKPLPVFDKKEMAKEDKFSSGKEVHTKSPMMHIGDSLPSDNSTELPPVE
ncbi:hypothetical protein LSH36_376g01001 [Paralvinella palmiformis]|uniref:Guanylate cyclase n=1 Tax=Paralvinella palmiformis TaxID=53620 RepID=A0AAD9N1S4_9ANNE|nr:hypothetical protein LSH36_376g01001 [Paralvinella palmiformis]